MINLYENDIPDDLDLGNSVAIDTETLGLNILCDRLCLVQLSSGNGIAHLVKFEKDSYTLAKNLKKLLSDKDILKIFHFARFDVAMLNYTFDLHISNIYCTKIASKISRSYTDKHGLRELCRELLSVDLHKGEQTSYWGAGKLRPEQLKYAANDVLHLHALKAKLDSMLVAEGRYDLVKLCCRFLEDIVADFDIQNKNLDYIFSH